MVLSIETPCINICKLENNVCIGCKRTIEEIVAWSSLSDYERKKIIKSLDNR